MRSHERSHTACRKGAALSGAPTQMIGTVSPTANVGLLVPIEAAIDRDQNLGMLCKKARA